VSTPSPPSAPPNVFLGWLLVALGGLIVLLCGGCTLGFWGTGLYAFISDPSGASLGAVLSLFITVGVVGGLPAAAGAVTVWAGWKMVRPPKKPAA
jgi:hypothetical protein